MKNSRKFHYDTESIRKEWDAFNNDALNKANRKTIQTILWTAIVIFALLAGVYAYNVLRLTVLS